MRALLLAAGRATRLGTLSSNTPKCLQEVGGEPLLGRLVRQLQDVGVQEFLINTHHLADTVVRYIQDRADKRQFTVVHEPELLGTLGTLRANLPFFGGESGWVLHADNYISGSLKTLSASFDSRPNRIYASALSFDTESPETHGVFEVDEEDVVTNFYEKVDAPPTSLANAATYIFDPRVWQLLEQDKAMGDDLSGDLVPALVGKIRVVRHGAKIIDIGTPLGLRHAKHEADQDELAFRRFAEGAAKPRTTGRP